MRREQSYSLQRIPLLRKNLHHEKSQDARLFFPVHGDSNIFHGVGRKHYDRIPQPHPLSTLNLPDIKPTLKIRRSILNVADIQGATPSVAPDSLKNILKAKKYYLDWQTGQKDSLDRLRLDMRPSRSTNEYEPYRLNTIQPTSPESPTYASPHMSPHVSSYESPNKMPSRYVSPTFLSSLALHH